MPQWGAARVCSWTTFILYTNDLPDVVSHARIVTYADDIKLYLLVTTIAEHNLLNKVAAWFSLWHLKPNPAKCVVLQLKNSNILHHIY